MAEADDADDNKTPAGKSASLTVKKNPIPEALRSCERQLIPAGLAPKVYRRRVDKTRNERTVTVKPRLPLLPATERKEVVWEKSEIVTPLDHPGEEHGRGYVRKGERLAVFTPGERTAAAGEEEGETGRPVPEQQAGLFLGEGLKQAGAEVRAEVSGFFRYGSNWIELFPFTAHEYKLYPSDDKLSCLLDFVPGSEQAVPPTAEQIIEEAVGMGFPAEELLEAESLAHLLSRALTDGAALKAEPLSKSADALIRVTVSEDKLAAHLTLRKARGRGKPLSLKQVGEAIRKHRFKGMEIERVREDILEFYRGPESRLEEYVLVEGREARQGEDGRIEWKSSFVTEQRVEELKRQAHRRIDQLQDFDSLKAFPLEQVEAMAEVQEGATVAEIVPAAPGAGGMDVFGSVRKGLTGREPGIQLFENLRRIGNEIVATQGGVLEMGEGGQETRVRVRPHQNREIQLFLSEDRMQASLTLLPARGTGQPLEAEAVRRVIAEAGVIKGLQEREIAAAVDRAKAGEIVENVTIATGQAPRAGKDTELEILVQMASGQRLTVAENGRADYRTHDTITVVKAGTQLARLDVPTPGIEGWDVTGKALPARGGAARYVHAGKHVECREQEDGTLQYYAKIDGELDYRESSIDVLQIHTVEGDVGLESGNVKFSGTVRITGSVASGFSVVSGESVFVEGSVQGALVSAGDAIRIEKGIVGEDKGVLRAKKSIRAHFAEQATLLAVEDIHLTNACLRCTVKCNGNMALESEKGNIVGGRVYCKLGVEAMNIGSEREVSTEIHFGQDILVQDQLEREQKQAERLQRRNTEIDRSITNLKRTTPGNRDGLKRLHTEKQQNLRQIQLHAKRRFILDERYEQHFPSQITVRGVIYPGVVLNSHGRRREIKTPLREVVFFFNTTSGRIEEKPLSG